MSCAEAGPLLCAGVTTFNSLRHGRAMPGDIMAVHGIGGRGHLAVQFARQFGFPVVAISRGKDKEEPALRLGAHRYVDAEALNSAQPPGQLIHGRRSLQGWPSGSSKEEFALEDAAKGYERMISNQARSGLCL